MSQPARLPAARSASGRRWLHLAERAAALPRGSWTVLETHLRCLLGVFVEDYPTAPGPSDTTPRT